MRARHGVIAALTVAVLSVSACAIDPPELGEAPELEVTAAVTEAQYLAVIEATFAQLEAADEELDAELLGDRIGDLAREVRAAQYATVAEDEEAVLQALPSAMQIVYVSGSEDWPRLLAAVSEIPSERLTPVVYLWVQEDVDSVYRLEGWAQMVPGASMPPMPAPRQGAAQAALSAQVADSSPRAVWEDYMELLRQGQGNDLDEVFAPDSYRERLFVARTALKKVAGEAGGDYIDTVQPDMDNTHVLLTSSGGALLFAPLEIASSLSVTNAKVVVDDPLLEESLTNKVTHHFRDFVVMYIPGPGAEQRPTVVAADHYLVRVSAG